MSTTPSTPAAPIIVTARQAFSLLSVAANAERHSLASGEAWVLLLYLQLSGEDLRLARNIDPVTFDAGDGAGPQIYSPFSFKLGDFAQSTNGQLPQLDLSASNIGRILQGVLMQYGGAVGADVKLYVVNTASPGGEAQLELDFEVSSTTANAKLVNFKLGASSPLRSVFPLHRFYPNHCIWRYNSPALQATNNPLGQQCMYSGPLLTCSLTLDGPNGCEAHGNSIRFGGFPGIDSQGASSAGVV